MKIISDVNLLCKHFSSSKIFMFSQSNSCKKSNLYAIITECVPIGVVPIFLIENSGLEVWFLGYFHEFFSKNS